ncbi:caspase family protein [Streptomyces sp. NBC_00555]|uniref:caspase family protein n=1 Tax=Streptomyces sp. NBC_00555 TaxID=2903662 RepID=UPI002250014A|nr:caspase family protein [Streptomyces sp. NBC_00555]MCX5012502.1 caspase family protein [Streptomyces sp. NBC_00555]
MTDRALLVGIDEYPDPANRLNSCIADTAAFKDLLGKLGFADSEIRVLHDADATLDRTREGLDWLCQGAQPGDRRVFFQSSHGYRYLKGDVMTEVLCCYDEFLEDTELVRRTAGLPRGVLTVILDACHSGGMEKTFFLDKATRLVRTKVFTAPPEKALSKANTLTACRAVKPFGRPALRDESSLLFNFANSPGKAFVPKGVVPGTGELNGILITACRADQTAAAGSAPTDWLSAFTYALLREVDGAIPVADLVSRAADRLASLNMSQTPCIFAPSGREEQLARTLISMAEVSKELIRKVEDLLKSASFAMDTAAKSPSASFGSAGSATKGTSEMTTTLKVDKAVDTFLDELKKASNKTAGKDFVSGDGWYSDVQTCSALFAPAIAAAAPPPGQGKALRPTLENPYNLAEPKFWDAIFQAGSILIPAVIDELTKSAAPVGGAAKGDVHAQIAQKIPSEFRGNDKFFGLVETLVAVGLPLAIEAFSKDYKKDHQAYDGGKIDLPLPAGLSEAERKSWLSAALNVAADCLPPLIRALS